MRTGFIVSVLFLLMVTGCTKDFDLNLDKQEPLIAIEGRISDLKGPFFVRVTKTSNALGKSISTSPPPGYFSADSVLAVQGALVIISDDMGVTDTLQPAVARHPERWSYSWQTGKLDSLWMRWYDESHIQERGYYETTKITGVPGHTYHLQVRVDDKEFHASAYMPFVPALDSAVLKAPIEPVWGAGERIPFVYFHEPQQEKNYYLLQHNDIRDYPYDLAYGIHDAFFVVDDKILPPYVNGLSVWRTEVTNAPYRYFQYLVMPKESVQVRLSSLTKEAYEYFKVLTSYYEADGNVYKPMPASARGNISGNALGLFYATSVSHKLIFAE